MKSGLRLKLPLLLLFSALMSPAARADIVDSSATGFTVKETVTIANSTPKEVYHHLVYDVGKWWNSSHTHSGSALNLSIDDKAGGSFQEKLADGGSVQHMAVVYAAPGKVLRMTGGLGPLQGLAVSGSMTWSISQTKDGIQVEVVYSVGGYRPGGMASWAGPVDKVLSEQIARFRHFVENGKPE
jgi:hypothetical protein